MYTHKFEVMGLHLWLIKNGNNEILPFATQICEPASKILAYFGWDRRLLLIHTQASAWSLHLSCFTCIELQFCYLLGLSSSVGLLDATQALECATRTFWLWWQRGTKTFFSIFRDLICLMTNSYYWLCCLVTATTEECNTWFLCVRT